MTINYQAFDIGLEANTNLENMVTLTVYNWQSMNTTDYLAFLTASHMWNNIRYSDDNREFATSYCHVMGNNSDSNHV